MLQSPEDNHIPADLADRIYHLLKQAKSSHDLNDELVNEVKHIIIKGRGKGWDWSRHWAAHTYLCWTQNFVKAYKCARIWANKHKPGGRLRILDLGCGAGASTAGTAVALMDCSDSIVIHGVDSSADMLRVYDKSFKEWADRTRKITATTELGSAEVYIRRSLGEWDLIVACYLFCGDPRISKRALSHPSMIVIDLPYQGFSEISIRNDRYRIFYDQKRQFNTAYLAKLDLESTPHDWYLDVLPMPNVEGSDGAPGRDES